MLLRVILALLAIVGLLSTAAAEERVALVIGNGAYAYANELPNPSNDATDMAAALEGIGFHVIKGIDLDRQGMEGKLREFAQSVRDAKIALFFYAGHGIQVNGRNFLIPVDAQLADSTALEFETIDAERIFGYMGGTDRIALAFLDACRNNPIARRFALALGNAARGAVAQGLAAPDTAGTGLFIGFSTAPGAVALDGEETRNSPFTAALVKNLPTPGLEIQQLMTRVKAEVQDVTAGEQRPWHNSDLSTDVFLVPALDTGPPGEGSVLSPDEIAWQVIQNSKVPEVFQEFLDRYPGSPRGPLAESRMASLRDEPSVPQDNDVATPADEAMELVFWKETETRDEAAYYIAYLESFPDGTFTTLARQKLAVIAEAAKVFEDGRQLEGRFTPPRIVRLTRSLEVWDAPRADAKVAMTIQGGGDVVVFGHFAGGAWYKVRNGYITGYVPAADMDTALAKPDRDVLTRSLDADVPLAPLGAIAGMALGQTNVVERAQSQVRHAAFVNYSGDKFFGAWGRSSEADAMAAAQERCPSCEVHTLSHLQCFALYRKGNGWGWKVGADIDDALNGARQQCEARNNGCYKSMTFCADGSNVYER